MASDSDCKQRPLAVQERHLAVQITEGATGYQQRPLWDTFSALVRPPAWDVIVEISHHTKTLLVTFCLRSTLSPLHSG